MLINRVENKLDIIILAGQSNAEGYGIGPCDAPFMPNPRILSMRDTDNYGYVVDEKTRGTFNIIMPRRYIINISEERQNTSGRIGCFALRFAERYLDSLTEDDRSVLIIHAAVGATGFAKKNWGLDGVLYQRLVRMTELALSMNPENRIKAFLWHQGEHDAIFRPELTDEERENTHTSDLVSMLGDFRGRFGSFPILMGGFTDEWSASWPKSQIIVSAMRGAIEKLGNAALVSAEGLPTNNIALANGDTYHFSRNSLNLLGERYFDVYKLMS